MLSNDWLSNSTRFDSLEMLYAARFSTPIDAVSIAWRTAASCAKWSAPRRFWTSVRHWSFFSSSLHLASNSRSTISFFTAVRPSVHLSICLPIYIYR